MSRLRFEQVTKTYPPGVAALRDVSFAVEPGEFVSLIGQSGAGKTTLLKLITAEEAPSFGRIWIGDQEISRIRPRQIPALRHRLGMVFQDYKLLPEKTVAENVAFALEVVGASRHEIRATVPKVLQTVRMEERADRFPAQLSGGERQRAAIARALVRQPQILLADEPTGNLDTRHTQEILDLLLRINGFGTTVVLVTHNRDVVNALQRRVLVLNQGALVQDDPVGRYHLSL